MNDLFDKHLGNVDPLVLDGDEFNLVTLGTEHIPKLLKLTAFFGMNQPKNDAEAGEVIMKKFQNAGEDIYKAITDLINITLRESFPDTDEKKLDKFGTKYMMQLLMHIMTINASKPEDSKKLKRIEEVKKRLQNDKPDTQHKESE